LCLPRSRGATEHVAARFCGSLVSPESISPDSALKITGGNRVESAIAALDSS